jgi:hypothetical protein
MPDLSFRIESARAEPFAASPLLAFRLHVANAGDEQVQSILLRAQIRLEAPRRRYSPGEQARLTELFGTPDRWSHTLRSLLWAHVQVSVPAFSGETVCDVHVPGTGDFQVTTARYFDALEGGLVPLTFLFSGTVFHSGEAGLQVAQIPWEKEAIFSLPVSVWKDLMQHYFPNSAFLELRKDVLDRLQAWKVAQGLPTLEQALERLLPVSP